MSRPIDDSLGNARLRRGRDFDKPPSSRPPVRRHYSGKEYIPGALFPGIDLNILTLTQNQFNKLDG